MRIVCPNCAAVYDVPDQALAGSPRLFRCARCAHQWMPAPPPPATSEPLPQPPRSAGFPRLGTRSRIDLPDLDAPVFGMPGPGAPNLGIPSLGPPVFGKAAPRIDLPPAAGGRPHSRLEIGQPLVEGGHDTSHGRDSSQSRIGGLLGGTVGNVAGIVGWALTVVVLVAAVALLLLRREQVEAMWPSSQHAYALFGLQ